MREYLPATREAVSAINSILRETAPNVVDPPAGILVGTLGTAIDYGIRFALHRCDVDDLVAAKGARRIDNYIPAALSVAFFEHLERVLDDHTSSPEEHERALARCCYVLALFDECYRGGDAVLGSSVTLVSIGLVPEPKTALARLRAGAWVDDLLAVATDEAVSDIVAVVGLLDTTPGGRTVRDLAATGLACNPKFPYPGGADADIVAGGCLIDIKALARPSINGSMLYQIVGYALLDRYDALGIESVGIYLARSGTLVRFDLDHLVAVLAGVAWVEGLLLPRTEASVTDVSAVRTSFLSAVDAVHEQHADFWRPSPEAEARRQEEAALAAVYVTAVKARQRALRIARRERAAGRSYRVIAERLNAQDVPRANGGRSWNASAVRAILLGKGTVKWSGLSPRPSATTVRPHASPGPVIPPTPRTIRSRFGIDEDLDLSYRPNESLVPLTQWETYVTRRSKAEADYREREARWQED